MSPEHEIAHDAIFDVLSSPRRRYVLYYLRRHGPTDILDLTAEVAAWEYGCDVDDLTSQQRKRVYVSLYQTHVPKMDGLGIVDYDQDSGMIQLTDRADEIGRYLTTRPADHSSWQRAYLLMAALGVVLFTLVVTDWTVFARVPDSVAAFVIVAGFGLLATAHYVHQRRVEDRLPAELQYGEE